MRALRHAFENDLVICDHEDTFACCPVQRPAIFLGCPGWNESCRHAHYRYRMAPAPDRRRMNLRLMVAQAAQLFHDLQIQASSSGSNRRLARCAFGDFADRPSRCVSDVPS